MESLDNPFAGVPYVYYVPEDGFVPGWGHRISMVYHKIPGHYPTGMTVAEANEAKLPLIMSVAPLYWGHRDDPQLSYKLACMKAETTNRSLGHTIQQIDAILKSSRRAPGEPLSIG